MKKIAIIPLFALLAALFFACTNDEPANIIDKDYIKSLTRGETTTSYVMKSVELFDKSDATGNEYVPVNLSNLLGWAPPGADIITIHEGNSCTPVSLFNLAKGPHPLCFPMMAYRKKTGFAGEVYVTRRMEYDEVNNRLTLDRYTYDIEAANETELILVNYSEYSGGVSGNGGFHKTILKYEVKKVDIEEIEKSFFYETDFDAYLGIIDIIRKEMGSVFDINPYFEGFLKFPDGNVDLDRLEAKLRENPYYWGEFIVKD